MIPFPSPKRNEQDQAVIRLLKELGSSQAAYPPELMAARRAAFLEQVKQHRTAETGAELSEGDQEVVTLLQALKTAPAAYPPKLLAARRAAFLAQVEQLKMGDAMEELSAEEREIVTLLAPLKSDRVRYPADLLAARRAGFLRQVERARQPSVWETFRASLQSLFPSRPPTGVVRMSFVLASLLVAALLGSLFLSRNGAFFGPSQVVEAPPHGSPLSSGEVAILICQPEESTSPCPAAGADASQDLADAGNGMALPAVSNDAQPSSSGESQAAYVNDGRAGASWVSHSRDGWVKIDLGEIKVINSVSLQKGPSGSSTDNQMGQFVISVALSDVYAAGDSSNDYLEYNQVFVSEQAGFRGTVSDMETIQTRFSPARARFVKITFAQAGAAIEEVGVFLIPPTDLAQQPTVTSQENAPAITSTPVLTTTSLPPGAVTSAPTGTGLPTPTAVFLLTDTSRPLATLTPLSAATQLPSNTPTLVPSITQPAADTPIVLPTWTQPPAATPTVLPTWTKRPAATPTPLPTQTRRPANTVTPVPTDPLPTAARPTDVPPTAIPPTVSPSPVSTETIVVTGNNQTATFTCQGNAAEIRGHANSVTLLGSCSSITVTGNNNHVFWESGSPVITDRGKDNIIEQL